MRKGRDGEKREKRGKKKEKTDENSGHYVIASSRPPERRPLERRTLAPKWNFYDLQLDPKVSDNIISYYYSVVIKSLHVGSFLHLS